MNRPARFTVADARRAGLAAKKLGPEWSVRIAPDGTINLVQAAITQPVATALADAPVPVEPQKLRVF